jgi:hypothetical protein
MVQQRPTGYVVDPANNGGVDLVNDNQKIVIRLGGGVSASARPKKKYLAQVIAKGSRDGVLEEPQDRIILCR